MPSRLRVGWALAIVLTGGHVGGCGDGDGGDGGGGDGGGAGGQCEGSFTACGGTLIGTWITDEAYLTLPTGGSGNDPYAGCATKPKSDVSIEARGSITFRADGTFQSEQSITASAETVISSECLAKLGDGQLTCEHLKGTPRGDACAVVQAPETEMQSVSGRYSTQGNQLVIESADDGESSGVTTYCVRGERLTVQTQSSNGAVIRSVGRRMR